MKYFPKKECQNVLTDVFNKEKPENIYDKHIESFKQALYQNCTTTAVAKRMLETLNSLA